MKAYKINTPFTRGQVHLVIANNMGDAEDIFERKYGSMTIESIELISEYVQVQGVDDD